MYKNLEVIFCVIGNDDREIIRRILQVKKFVACLNAIWWSEDTDKQRKYNIYDALVWLKVLHWLLYAAETRDIQKNLRQWNFFY